MASSVTFIVCLRSSRLLQNRKPPKIPVTLSLFISMINIAKEVDRSSLKAKR